MPNVIPQVWSEEVRVYVDLNPTVEGKKVVSDRLKYKGVNEIEKNGGRFV